ncbi:hypothetical protein BN14_00834 [Rhizoctonia solani AG-1 IB]|uniref:Uncharacterized protein n=1 Tax=Thanatephorus cucumeris (strain AG1-IB / isolate 7/3/14) TaxID=1108050 RepID=M5BIA3_THACB|nr:hypothetical protein BN14_00834 [Rhizoctonia solani AG-1 IB]
MPPQTRSRLQTSLVPMGSLSPSAADSYDESSTYMYRQKESGDWDERYGAPIRPPVTRYNTPPPTNPSHDRPISSKRKFVSMAVQTSPIEEICPPLCRDNGSSSGSSPDPETDEEGHPNKNGLKRAGYANISHFVAQ